MCTFVLELIFKYHREHWRIPNTLKNNTRHQPEGRKISAISKITTSNFRNKDSHNLRKNNRAQIKGRKISSIFHMKNTYFMTLDGDQTHLRMNQNTNQKVENSLPNSSPNWHSWRSGWNIHRRTITVYSGNQTETKSLVEQQYTLMNK